MVTRATDPLSDRRSSPGASSGRRPRPAGNGRPGADCGPSSGSAHASALTQATSPRPVATAPLGSPGSGPSRSTDSTPPPWANRTSPGIDSGYSKRFERFPRFRGLPGFRGLPVKTSFAPMRSTRCPGRVEGASIQLEQFQDGLDLAGQDGTAASHLAHRLPDSKTGDGRRRRLQMPGVQRQRLAAHLRTDCGRCEEGVGFAVQPCPHLTEQLGFARQCRRRSPD